MHHCGLLCQIFNIIQIVITILNKYNKNNRITLNALKYLNRTFKK